MTSINRFRRWLVVIPLTLFAVLVWDVTSRLLEAEKTAQEQFVRGFEVDASRREGMRDLLARDVQSALMYALHNISDVQTLPTNEERGERLITGFEQLGFMLRSSRYDFIEVFLTEQTGQGKLVLRGRYPSAANLGEIDPSDTPLFAHVDLSKAELFISNYEIYNVESDPVLLITDSQPVLVNTRLIVDGNEDFSSWYLSVRAGVSDLHKSIDLIGQQMAGGVTPMRVISFDAKTDVCLTVWEVGKGTLDCDEASSEETVAYKTEFTSETGEQAYSIYQPTDAYRQFRAAPADESEVWRSFLPAVLALVLLLTTISYLRYRSESEGLMSFFTRSLSDKDTLNSSIHEVLSSHLEIMSRFAYAMRQKDVLGEERRYFDIAISEFLEASLSLNTLVLERPPTSTEHDKTIVPTVDLAELTELAQMALEVATVDTPLETKFFVPEDFPKTIPGCAYSVQTAVIAAINLSAQGTEEGRIEVSLWVDSEGPSPCLYLRLNDTGVGWGDLSENSDSRAMTDDNIAFRALVSCLKFSGTTLERQSETELGNEYVLKLCDGGEGLAV